jgi:glutaredoxin
LSVGANQPVDFALRNAVEDLTQFDDIDEVLSAYTPSSYEQYKLEGGIYAIPETQQFNVMFYRKDILEQLELEVPQTWQDLVEMLPTIQGNNMSVGIPTAAGSSGATNATAVATAMLFTTATCPNCKIAAALLDKAGVKYEKLLANEHADLVSEYGIKQAPTLIVGTPDGALKLTGVSEIKKYLEQ